MKTFKLIHDLNFDVTRSVYDMAALFAYFPERNSSTVLRICYAENSCRAILQTPEQELFSSTFFCDSDISGEVTRCIKLAVLDVLAKFTREKPYLPWGILTGVRPGKLAHKLLDIGVAAENLPEYLQGKYLLPLEQGRLLRDICILQDKVLPDRKSVGIYIGIPFCPSKCTYCSFPSGIVPQDEESQQNFLNFIEQDIDNVVKLISMYSLNISSLYIGGGTPTSLKEKVFARLMDLAAKKLLLPSVQEFTVEAGRPDCFSAEKLRMMEAAGVNRISVNPQTLHDKTLQLIGRKHSAADFYQAYEMAANSSIPIINTDLIVGLPGETAAEIEYSIGEIAKLKPQNITIHTLTLKKGAEMFGGKLTMSALQAEQVLGKGAQIVSEIGMKPYYLYRQHYMLGQLANVGYALPGTESIYNIQMMEERHTVIGIGPSSATKVPLQDGHHLHKLNMPKNIATYTENIQQLSEKRRMLFEQ